MQGILFQIFNLTTIMFFFNLIKLKRPTETIYFLYFTNKKHNQEFLFTRRF